MLPTDLQEMLEQVNSSRESRYSIAFTITKKPHYVRETLQWCFTEESDLLVKAAWCLELICEHKTMLFLKYDHLFFERLPSIKNHSALHSCAKICEMLCHFHYMKTLGLFAKILNEEKRKVITECCFDWLITDQKVACQASAMQCLYFLGKDERWIYPELKVILEEKLHTSSPGYQARAKQVLKKIQKARF